MASENTTTDPASEPQGGQATTDQPQTTPEPGANGSQPVVITSETQLPDDHPLVTAYQRAKTENQSLKDAKAEADKVPGLTSELETAKATAAKLAPLQAQYDRLEAFLTALGGPVAQILDSRTFSKRLFESDDKLDDIVKDWHRANPSQTRQALGGGAAQPADKKPTQNDLLRIAAQK